MLDRKPAEELKIPFCSHLLLENFLELHFAPFRNLSFSTKKFLHFLRELSYI